uniref:Uncharacterized protein n=1 Tax=Gouania willdenowi TaxID=441366 RepID=A0A8C5DH13_GOUWI
MSVYIYIYIYIYILYLSVYIYVCISICVEVQTVTTTMMMMMMIPQKKNTRRLPGLCRRLKRRRITAMRSGQVCVCPSGFRCSHIFIHTL